MAIWDKETLEALQKYTKEIIIVGLAWAVFELYQDNVKLRDERYETTKQDRDYWRESDARTERDAIIISQRLPTIIHDTLYLPDTNKKRK